MKTAIANIVFLLITQSVLAQVYINDGVFIPAGGIIHSNEEVRLSNTADVYNGGTIHSHEQVLVSGGNFIWMGGNAHIMTTIPSGQSSSLGIGVNTNNRIILQQNSGQPQAYMIGLRTGVFENPETGGSIVPSGIADRTWTVEPLWQSGTTDITLSWNAVEEININRDSIAIASWKHGNSTQWTRHGHAPVTNTGSSPEYERTTSLNMDMGNLYYLHITDTTTPTRIKGLNGEKPALLFSIYPNPANNMVHYSISGGDGTCQLLLHDIAGKLIATRSHTIKGNAVTGILDVGTFAGGVYTLTLRTADGQAETKRLVIDHK